MSSHNLPLPQLTFRSDINGLRALAVMSVIAFHAMHTLLPGGFAGVDVFFVISGYLISRIILEDLHTGCFSLPGFYAKRVKRIFPALVLVLLSTWAACWFLLLPPLQYSHLGRHLANGAFFSLNFRLMHEGGYFDIASEMKPLLHLWSLSIEEQFYVVWPALMIGLFRFRSAVLPAIIILFSASLVFCIIETSRQPAHAFYLPWSRAWELALGAGLAYRELFRPQLLAAKNETHTHSAFALGLLMMLGSFVFLQEGFLFPGWRALFPTVGCALIIAYPGSRWGQTILGNPLTQFLGLISYPLYLWHWPLFSGAHIMLGEQVPIPVLLGLALLAVLLATATYYFVERSVSIVFIRKKWATTLAIATCLLSSGLLGIATTANKGFLFRFPPNIVEIFNFPPADYQQIHYSLGQCLFDDNKQNLSLEKETAIIRNHYSKLSCTTIRNPARPTILIVGDSHSADLLPGITDTFGNKANILMLGATYCVPLIENVLNNSGRAGTNRCHAFNTYAFEEIRKIKPDILVVGSNFESYMKEDKWLYPNYLAMFNQAVHALHAEGLNSIVIVGQHPIWNLAVPELVGNEMLSQKTPSEFSNASLQSESLATDMTLRNQNWGKGITYVSLIKELCNPRGCRRMVGAKLPGDIITIDSGHLSRNGSIYVINTILAPIIRSSLATSFHP